MKTMLRVALGVSLVCLFGGAAALLAGVGAVEEGPPLRFDPDPFVLPSELDRLGSLDVEVAVVNDSNQPARVVGVREFCAGACFYGRGLPVDVPAGGRAMVMLQINARAVGPISEELEFFTDRPSQPKLILHIEGNIREKAPDAEPAPTPES